MSYIKTGVNWNIKTKIEKGRTVEGTFVPYQIDKVDGNALTKRGANAMFAYLVGNTTATEHGHFNASNTRIYVGSDSNTVSVAATYAGGFAATYAHASLMAGFPKFQASYGSDYDYKCTFKAQYEDREATFVWNEWGLANGDFMATPVEAILLNRKVAYVATKPNDAQWRIEINCYMS